MAGCGGAVESHGLWFRNPTAVSDVLLCLYRVLSRLKKNKTRQLTIYPNVFLLLTGI